MSISPGVTSAPAASITSVASPVSVSATAATLPPLKATSRLAEIDCAGSTSVPPRTSRFQAGAISNLPAAAMRRPPAERRRPSDSRPGPTGAVAGPGTAPRARAWAPGRARARRPAQLSGRVGGQRRDVAGDDGARPPAGVVELIEDRSAMRARQGRERPLLGAGIVEIHAEREDAEVRVRPRLDVLVPAHGVAPVGPFEVQLRAVEANIRSDQVGDEIDDGRISGERPQVGVLIDGLAQPADVRLLCGVIWRQVELIVRGGERARFLDLH